MDRPAFKMDSAEKRLNELGYKQELRREMVSILIIFPLFSLFFSFFDSFDVWIRMFFMAGFLQTLFKTLAITFSSMAVFTGSPLYGPSLRYAGPASLIWGWVVVTFFTWFVGFAMAEICSSFPVYIISHRLPLPLFIHHGIRPLNCPSINKICQ
ncbi:hypothetical protein OIU84_013349 [Salix udensis]|uniref:Uncharacterized protein n=1 Tax=Salix udensis TaxID=889485 RepID=A0AAD6JHV2_9ROSI|nr:hypothetical protein OIU84_013349 [Salix udensis]